VSSFTKKGGSSIGKWRKVKKKRKGRGKSAAGELDRDGGGAKLK